jgi:uncharacterized protein
MKRLLALATAMLFASTTALAFHCPKDMKAIDEALAKNPKLSDAQMQEVKMLRAKGEEEHKAGKHQEAVDDLGKAMKILNISAAAPAKS